MELFLKLDKSHYRLGDTIDVEVQARVEGGRSDVDKITAILVQEMIFSDKIDTPKESESVKELLVFAEATDEDDTNSGETRTYKLQLEIDERLPITSFPNCDFISMEYYVHAVARTHSFYDDIVVKLPIVIDSKDGGDAAPEDVDPEIGSLEDHEEDDDEDGEGEHEGEEVAAIGMLVDVEDEEGGDDDASEKDKSEEEDKEDEDEDKSEKDDDDDEEEEDKSDASGDGSATASDNDVSSAGDDDDDESD